MCATWQLRWFKNPINLAGFLKNQYFYNNNKNTDAVLLLSKDITFRCVVVPKYTTSISAGFLKNDFIPFLSIKMRTIG
jgi:hypothetical protein